MSNLGIFLTQFVDSKNAGKRDGTKKMETLFVRKKMDQLLVFPRSSATQPRSQPRDRQAPASSHQVTQALRQKLLVTDEIFCTWCFPWAVNRLTKQSYTILTTKN